MKYVLLIIVVIFFILLLASCIYVYNNLNYDKKYIRKTKRSGFIEKQVTLPNGNILNYAEGPNNGQALFLIHGQLVSWVDYMKVLPELSKNYHVYAIDCHGHGKSSRMTNYTAEKIGTDFIWFIENVIKEPVVVSGHSSGGLLTAWLAANSPKNVKAIVLEDPPFFATEASRCKNTFAWVDSFKTTHEFLKQDKEKDYVIYYMENCYFKNYFGKSWNSILKSAKNYREKYPDSIIKIFYLPPAINRIYYFMDYYDPKFGDSFYDCSWFINFNQEETLKRIKCPSILLHTNVNYDEKGILQAAMDKEDAKRAHLLMKDNKLIEINCGHDIHWEKPKEFISNVVTVTCKRI